MEENLEIQFKKWKEDPMFGYFEKRMREQADLLREQADVPQVDVHDRLWLLAKAQGIDESLKQPDLWLKEKK